MLQSSRILLAALATAVPCVASAQVDASDVLAPTGPIQFAGTFDAQTGTLQPADAGSFEGGIGPSLFRNTCPTGFLVQSTSTEVLADVGRIPSSTSPSPVGPRDSYQIRAFQIGYATAEADVSMGGPGAHVIVRFYNDLDECTDPSTQGPPLATFDLSGLPGSMTAPAVESKVVTVTLGTSQYFCVAGDASARFDGSPALDTFGYTLQLADQTAPGGGILIGSDPTTCAAGDGTLWSNPTGEGTGRDMPDSIRRDPTAPNCINFSGTPYAGLWMGLNGSATENCTPGLRAFCTPVADGAGCTAVLTSTGIARKTLGLGRFRIEGTQIHNQQFYFGFYGLSQGTELNFNNGFRCAQAPLVRLLPTGFTSGNVGPPDCSGFISRNINPMIANNPNVQAGDTIYIQMLYRDSPSGAMPTHGVRAFVFP